MRIIARQEVLDIKWVLLGELSKERLGKDRDTDTVLFGCGQCVLLA
jgi:hypothetical protein